MNENGEACKFVRQSGTVTRHRNVISLLRQRRLIFTLNLDRRLIFLNRDCALIVVIVYHENIFVLGGELVDMQRRGSSSVGEYGELMVELIS